VPSSVSNPHHLDADPVLFHFDVDTAPNPTFTLMKIRIRILQLAFTRFELPMLQNGPLRLPSFHFDADPNSIFHFDTDPDPASKNDADPDRASKKDGRIRIRYTGAQSTHRAILGALGGAGDAMLPDLLLARLLELEAEPPVLCAPPPSI
jgi:hypothetical protein